MHHRAVEAVIHRDGECQRPQDGEHDKEERPQRVQYQPHRLKEQFQKTAEGVADGLLDFILAALDGHPRHRLQFRRRPAQVLNLPLVFLVADQIGCFRVPHQCLVFQFLPFLGVLLHVKRLPLQDAVAAGDDGTHDAVDGSQHEGGEEHDARPDAERAEQRIHVYRLGA